MLGYIYNIADYIAAGGIVMIPLVLISIFVWSLIVERLLFFNSLYKQDRIRTIAMNKFLEKRTGNQQTDQLILEEIRLSISMSINGHIPLIKTLAAIAPLLGLLGTVTGMIKTFDVISIFGTGNAKLMAMGISEALITTQTGLIVAIPALYMGRFLERRSERLRHNLDSAIMRAKRHK